MPHTRVAIVGTGFAGLGMSIALKREGITDFVVFERANDVGGTWRDNTYPGCQCDVPSHLYSFSFAMNPNWSRTYSPQPEIWEYLRNCAERYGVMPHIRFDHEVRRARWSNEKRAWCVETSQGEWTADILISANGGLAEPRTPEIEGIDDFKGEIMHSAKWNVQQKLQGQRVAVIGTGASAIQIVPKIQPSVSHLSVFQRTPPWVLPHTDRPITEFERRLYRRVPVAQKAVRGAIYSARELLVLGMTKDPRFLAPVRRVATAHLHKQVKDRDLRRKLTPAYSPGCKRLLLSDHYYPALTKDNVELVTDPIAAVTPTGIATRDGRGHAFDALVFATGFRVTDNPAMDRIHGRDGRTLKATWAEDGMKAYLGTTAAGFPNLFLMTGPNTGQGHTSLVVMIEAQIRYIVDALRYMNRRGVATVDVKPDVVKKFNDKLQSKMSRTVWNAGGCSSWYLDEQGNNPTLWPDFTWKFRTLTKRFDAENYDAVPEYVPATTGKEVASA